MSNPDLDPHKPARAAMWLWGACYAKSGLGSMGFWREQLTEEERDLCRRMVAEIEAARPEHAAPARQEEPDRGR